MLVVYFFCFNVAIVRRSAFEGHSTSLQKLNVDKRCPHSANIVEKIIDWQKLIILYKHNL